MCRAGSEPDCSQLPTEPVSPSIWGSCELMMSNAAACVKAVSTGELTRFSNQPARTNPSPTCSRPDSSASHTARLTHSALPG